MIFVSNFTRLTARETTYNNFEISPVVFMPNITKKNKSCYYLYKYWPIFRMKQSLSFCIVVLMIWIGNTVNHLWNKHKHCSQRKIEAALLFSSSNDPWFSWAVCKREKLKWRDGDAICFSLSRACHFPRNFQENGRQKLSMLL